MAACKAPDCERKAHAKGMCPTHYGQMQRYGKFMRKHNPPGTGCIDSNGYVKIMVDGVSTYQHRIVAEEILDRTLRPDEEVHHIDDSFAGRSNNHPANLAVVTVAEHNALHGRGSCQHTIPPISLQQVLETRK